MNLKDFYAEFCSNVDLDKKKKVESPRSNSSKNWLFTKIKTCYEEHSMRLNHMPLKKRLNFNRHKTASDVKPALPVTLPLSHFHKFLRKDDDPDQVNAFKENGYSENNTSTHVHDPSKTNSIFQSPKNNHNILEKTTSESQTEESEYVGLYIIPVAAENSVTFEENKFYVDVSIQTDIPEEKKVPVICDSFAQTDKDTNLTDGITQTEEDTSDDDSITETDDIIAICGISVQTDKVTIISEEEQELLNIVKNYEYTKEDLEFFHQYAINDNNNQNDCDNLNHQTGNENKNKDQYNKQSDIRWDDIKCSTMQKLGTYSELNILVHGLLYTGQSTNRDEDDAAISKKFSKISDKAVEKIFRIIYEFVKIHDNQSKILEIIDLVEDDDNEDCEVLPRKRLASPETTGNSKRKQAKSDETVLQNHQIISSPQANDVAPQQAASIPILMSQRAPIIQKIQEYSAPYIQRMHSMPNMHPYEERLPFLPQNQDPRLLRCFNPTQLNQPAENAWGKQPSIQNFQSKQLRQQFYQASKQTTPTPYQIPQVQNYVQNPVSYPQNTYAQHATNSRLFEDMLKLQDIQCMSHNSQNSYIFNYPKR